jgi:hypothetical protein
MRNYERALVGRRRGRNVQDGEEIRKLVHCLDTSATTQ